MMDFIIMTLSFMVALMLSSTILTVIMFKLAGNAKVIKWLTNYYMKQMTTIFKNFDDMDLGA